MSGRLLTMFQRRDLLRLAIAGTAAAATGAVADIAIAAQPTGSAAKRKARYQPNSAEVKNFYRVNSYPAR